MKRIGIQFHNDDMSEDTLKGTVTILEGKTTTTMTLTGSFSVEMVKNTIRMTGKDGEHLPQIPQEHQDMVYTMLKCYHAGLRRDNHVYHWTDL